MAEFDYNTRRVISDRRKAELNRRIEKFAGRDRELAREVAEKNGGEKTTQVIKSFYDGDCTPSGWFRKKDCCRVPGYIKVFWTHLFQKLIRIPIFILLTS